MTLPVKVTLAQINSIVGDIAGNSAKILQAYEQGKAQGVDIVVCPELSLIGYPPEDLILMPAFRAKVMQEAKMLAAKILGDTALVIGSIWEQEGKVFNAALVLAHGEIIYTQCKTMLPNYGVFDEKRLFSPGETSSVLIWKDRKIGLLICEDIWDPHAAKNVAALGADMLIVMNASPFETGKLAQRYKVAKAAVQQARVPLVYVNMVGGQDDIVFDGASFIIDAGGNITHQLPEFEEIIVTVDENTPPACQTMSQEETMWQAMTLGLRDYVHKNGFSSVLLGLSGGIDSALSAAVAVDALGPTNVTGILLPSPYTSKDSVEDALKSAQLLGIKTINIPITASMSVLEEVLNPVFKDASWMENVAIGGNVQARLRGLTLMSLSNRFGSLLLSTGNKSEIAVGYSTLYGDSCGGFNVLKDVYKTQVYGLAAWRNARSEVIPKRSIDKAPSAELAPGQKDQDQLPPYDILDKILAHHLEKRLSAEEITAIGFESGLVKKILTMVRINEYKRYQSCPGVKLTSMMFGRDRRFPLTNRFS